MIQAKLKKIGRFSAQETKELRDPNLVIGDSVHHDSIQEIESVGAKPSHSVYNL
ncbi:MAG: hypothetical protein QW407_06680 [Thermofilaceae archaeon]